MRLLFATLALVLAHHSYAAKLTAPVNLRLSCPIQNVFLDGTAVLGQASEELVMQARPVKLPPNKAGKPQGGWFSDAKITSNKRLYEGNLLAVGVDYAIVAYADVIRESATSSLMNAVYQINLRTLQFKRTITFFPDRKDSSSEGVCQKL